MTRARIVSTPRVPNLKKGKWYPVTTVRAGTGFMVTAENERNYFIIPAIDEVAGDVWETEGITL